MDLLRRAGAGELAALLGKALAAGRPRAPPAPLRRPRRRGAGRAARARPRRARALCRRRQRRPRGAGGAAVRIRRAARRAAALGRRRTRCSSSGRCTSTCRRTSCTACSRAAGCATRAATPAQLAFLLPTASGYDAPLDAAAIDEAARAAAGRGAGLVRQAGEDQGGAARSHRRRPRSAATTGSSPARARKSGAAIVANDMHLSLRLPHIWYRAALEVERRRARRRRLVGVTLPGAPAWSPAATARSPGA